MLHTFIGDVHGNYPELIHVIEKSEGRKIILGDVGFGFSKGLTERLLNLCDKSNTYFIHGNHDNVDECKNSRRFLGRYSFDPEYGILFISGEYSIDKMFRKPMLDWWPTEELSYAESIECLAMVHEYRNDINYVVSHGCPYSIMMEFIDNKNFVVSTNTNQLLDRIFEIIKPKEWIFGHYHKNKSVVVNNVKFTCVNILDKYVIDIPRKE